MAQLTIEQQRALALARARMRVAEQSKAAKPTPAPAKKEPPREERNYLADIARAGVRGVGSFVEKAIPTVIERTPDILAKGIRDVTRMQPGLHALIAPALEFAPKIVAPEYRKGVAPVTEAARKAGEAVRTSVAPRQRGDVYEEYERSGVVGGLASLGETFAESAPGTLAALATGVVTRSPRAASAVMAATSAPQTFASIMETQKEQGIDDVDLAVVGTAASSALDVFTGVGGVIRSLAGRKAAEEAFKRGVVEAAKRVTTTGFKEGGTEVLQNVIEQVAGGADPRTKEAMLQSLEAGMVGVLGGTAIGSVAEGVRPLLDAKEAPEGTVERGAEPLESVEIAVPNPDDPNIINRERVDILSAPDAEGNVVVRRADGKPRLVPVEALDSMRVPEEGGFTPSDAFSGEMIYGRLKVAAGAEADKKTVGFTEALNRKLSNDLALGRVQDAADYISALEKRFSGVRKRQAATEAAKEGIGAIQDPTLRVLFEAKSILNDYRVEFAKQQAQPGVTVGAPVPPPTETLAQSLERNRTVREEENAIRADLLQQIASDPNVIDKHSAFADALTDYGLTETSDAEAATLLDAMRRESEFETASAKGQESIARQAALRRGDIIESALSDTSIDLPNRVRKVNADLSRAGFEPTSPEEVTRIRGRSFAEDVFGPRGEYQRRLDAEAEQRQSVFDSIMADDSVTDKYRAFVELADDMGLAPPSANELEMMREAVAGGAPKAPPVRTVQPEVPQAEFAAPVEAAPIEAAPTYDPYATIGQIESLLAEEGLTPDSPEFYQDPTFAGLFDEYLTAKAAAAQEGAPETPAMPQIDLSAVAEGANMKERKAAAVAIVQELTAGQTVPKKLINQAADQIAKGVVRGQDVDPVAIVARVVGPAPEVAAPEPVAAPEVAAPEPVPAPEPEVPVTKLEPGVARGVKSVERGTQGVIKGRPVEGAAELTAGMQEEQELTKRLNSMRNNNLISDQDIGEVLNLVRVPASQEALNALPTAQRERWTQVLDLTRDMNAKAEQRDAATGKEKAQLNEAIKAIDTQLDGVRSQIAKYAMGEAAMRVEGRKAARRRAEESFKAGDIDKAERDRQLAELRVDKALAPRMAEKDVTGVRTEASKRSLDVAKRTRSSRAVLQSIADEGGPLGEVAQRLLTFVPDTRVVVVDPETLRLAARERGEKLADVPYMEGVWLPSRNAIYLSSGMSLDHTPVHEAVHPILDLHIEQGTDEGRAITDIFKMYKELASPEQRDTYGFRDAHEFASEVWGNEQFRQLLRDLTPQPTKVDPKPRNLLQRILDAFVSMIRKEAKTDAAAAPVVDYIEQVMQLTESAAGKPLRGEGKARAIESRLRENPNNPRAGQVGIMARLQQLKKQYAKARSDAARKLNYKYQDVVDYDKQLAAIYGVDKLPDNMAVSNKAELLEASRAGRQVLLDRNYIKPILDKMATLELDEQDVGMYLWARSAKDRNALVRSRNAEFPEGGSGMTDAEAEAILKDFALRGLVPKLNQIAKMHDRMVDYMLNLRVQEGLLTRKQADAARKAQPFYTPLKGYAADGDMQTMGDDNAHNDSEYQRNLGIRRSEYTKSQGRRSMPYNPLDMLFADAKQIIQRASINRVGQQLLDNLISDPEANADVATYYTDDNPKIRVKPSENTEYPDGTPVRANMRMERGQYLVVKRNGTPYYIEFADTDAGRALKRAFDNMTPQKLEGFMKFWVKGANTVKSLLTRYSPPYLPRALARDIQDAVANAYAAETDKASPAFGKKLGAKVAAYSTPASKTGRLIDAAIMRFVSGTEPGNNDTAEMMLLLEQMMEDGGSPGHSTVHDLELITAEAKEYLARARELKAKDPVRYAKEVPQAVRGALNAASEYIDLKARLATYVAALEAGIDREGAARLALNSSLNLTRRGEWARALDSTFFFWSPAMESARRFKNMALNTSNGRKIIASQMAIGGMLTVWNMLMGSGDDDDDGRPNWMDLPDATKQTSLVIMTGPGRDDYIALPLGFMLSFPAYAGQKLTEAAYGAISPEAASISIADSLLAIPSAAATTFSPVKPQGEDAQQFVSSFLPNLVKPLGDIAINRNYFGTPIYTEQFDSDRAASSLGREDTGRVWKWIARSMNDMSGGYGSVPGAVDFAPEAYRYFFEAHAGGLYRFGEDTYKFIAEDNKDDKTLAQRVPVVRSYVGKGGEYVPMTQYYKNAAKVGALVRQEKYEPDEFLEATEKFPVQSDPRVMEAYKMAEKERDRIGRERREMLLGIDDPEARRDIIDMYRDEERQVFMLFNRTFNDVKAEYK